MNVRFLALVVTPVLTLVGCDDDQRHGLPAASTRVASSVGTTVAEMPSELDSCRESPPVSGDVDGDGHHDTVTLRLPERIITVRLGAGPSHEVPVESSCPSLLGLSDVNSDGRDEVWWKDGRGNTAHLFNLVAWVDNRPLVVVEPAADNPLLIGWGFSGGATLWCADANGDGRTDIIRHEFSRSARGELENEREFVYDLHGGALVNVSEGPARTPLPDSIGLLRCGSVTW